MSPDEASEEDDDVHDTFVMNNVWQVKSNSHNPRWRARSRRGVVPRYASWKDHGFKATVMINNKFAKLLADTGAKVSVCGMKQAKAWGILHLLQPSDAKIRPYQSKPIPVRGVCTVGVTFKNRTVPVTFHVLPGSCEPILAGKMAEELRILVFQGDGPYSANTIYSMIETKTWRQKPKRYNRSCSLTETLLTLELVSYPEV